jgi:hypothetical protein
MAVNYRNLKQTPIPVVPRTMPIVNADGTVTRSGQLLLEQLQAPSVTEGTHAQRPDPRSVADGTLYVESDRGVVYYNNQGFWVYLAGTMWDTLNPDHRPTDLGPQDANFEYKGTDQAREFYWTGYKWVEATLVRYGTHAQRLALTLANVTDSELFVEWDRPFVIYQNQGGVWHYIAGTMFGTLSPDQRPTDLGANDAGFDFRGTDQQREFIWSQTAWVEVTPAWSRGTSGAIYYNGGNVGVGTATPHKPLEVFNSAATTVTAIFGNSSGAISMVTDANVGCIQGYNGTGATASANIALQPGGGNVGIGTLSPAYSFDVAGDANCSGVYRRAGVAGVTATITTAKLTTAGANGSLTFSGGILTGFVQAT